MGASSVYMIYNVSSSVASGRRTLLSALPQIILCACMMIGCLITPRLMKRYQKKQAKKKEQARQEKYSAYLEKMSGKIDTEITKQTQILKEINLSTKECCSVIMNQNRNFWARTITDNDFLNIRLGIGNIKSFIKLNAPQEHFSMSSDNLQEMAFEVGRRSEMLRDVPISISLKDQSILAFVFNCTYKNDYFDNLIVQLAALQSADDLKIVVLTSEDRKDRWDYIKYFPHTFSEDKSLRFFASTMDEIKEISSYLARIYNSRYPENEGENKRGYYKQFQPYYLVITDDYKNIKNTDIVKCLESGSVNVGFSLITISNSLKDVSGKCEKFVEIGEKESCILEKELKTQQQIVFTNEYEKNIDMRLISMKLSNVPLMPKDGINVLPSMLSFLEMYDVSKIEQLNVVNRWQMNSPVKSLSTPIGVHVDGSLFKLDLHEKAAGPHGLIAGSTGSGKSEFIITYILSMAINYHPYEVQFVLIDYKGGGLAGAFQNNETGIKIPHLVGTITNLDTAEMNRTLVSISSELKRRQRKFNEVKDKLGESTIDIYKYQKFYREGLIDEPMSHLFIISDEFAELKKQQPEFLQELVSTARIGRSLGVHLILATQKPSGVVNDQIWSNSKFKVCLKVQDKSDSMEMLKRPEAAMIKEAGRFYLQVGYNDYFDIGQSAWGGAKYVPTDKIVKKNEDSICLIDNVGNIVKSINDVVKKEQIADLGDQLTNTVKYIYNVAKKENIKTKNLWLDRIPPVIYLSDVTKKYQYKPTPYFINPVIGEYDNPVNQEQGLLNLPLSDGNTLIYGKGGSGKENLLSTIIWSTCVEHTPKEANLYIIDCGAESLKTFRKFPHVGSVAGLEDERLIYDTFDMVIREMDRRKELYADYGGSYKNYCDNSGSKDPLIITIINNYEIFGETYRNLPDSIQNLYRDGAKYGIVFIVTCTTINSIRSRVAQYFVNKISLQLPNNTDYRDAINAPRGLVPQSCFGRGLATRGKGIFEFQTANICDLKQINNVIRNAATQLAQAYTYKAKQIKIMPKIVTLEQFDSIPKSLDNMPIGVSLANKEVVNYNFLNNKVNVCIGNDISNRLNFVNSLIKMMSKLPNVNLKVIDLVDVIPKKDDIYVIKEDFNREIAMINNEIVSEAKSDKINFYIVIGIGEYKRLLPKESVQMLGRILGALGQFNKSYAMLIDNYSLFKKIQLEPWYYQAINSNSGIWLGTDVGSQVIFNLTNITLDEKRMNFDYMGFAIDNGKHTIIKYVVDGDSNEK